MKQSILLDGPKFQITIQRLCRQLIENHGDFSNTVIIGIQPRGTFLAKCIVKELEKMLGTSILSGDLDITFYRDDLDKIGLRTPSKTEIPFDLNGKTIVLVDDVIYSGRTIGAALNAIHDYGRPKVVRLLTLIDRGHRELPIHPDYVGRTLPTSKDEQVKVFLSAAGDGRDGVELIKPN